jgi:putative ABC transport system ATP-binding protein
LLKLSGVSKSYGAAPVLRGIELALNPAEYIAIMGESGSGKSTLLNLIAGLDTPDSGAIRFDDVNINELSETERTRLRREHMGFVFQSFHLLPHLTVAQNVALPLALNGASREKTQTRMRAMLEAVKLDRLGERYPRELSGGEMQRVAIARALAHSPKLVLADEPTGNLDAASAAQVLALFRERVAEGGAAAILVTHSRIAAASADVVYSLDASGLHLMPEFR